MNIVLTFPDESRHGELMKAAFALAGRADAEDLDRLARFAAARKGGGLKGSPARP